MGFGPARLTRQGVFTQETYADRVIRDRQYKLWVEDETNTRLFDLDEDPAEKNNLIAYANPDVAAARRALEEVVESFPSKDARPRYDPTPAQPWDLKLKK